MRAAGCGDWNVRLAEWAGLVGWRVRVLAGLDIRATASLIEGLDNQKDAERDDNKTDNCRQKTAIRQNDRA